MSLDPNDPRHGTVTAYNNHGCRCDACRIASSEYQRRRRSGGCRKDMCRCGSDKDVRARLCVDCFNAERYVGCGSDTSYHRGCRCSQCRAATAAVRRAHRASLTLEQREAQREYDRERKRKARARERANA